MWTRSFVATAVALGEGVEDAVAVATREGLDQDTAKLLEQLRAPERRVRTAALAAAVKDIVLAIDEVSFQ